MRTGEITVQVIESAILGVDDHDGVDVRAERMSGGVAAGARQEISAGAPQKSGGEAKRQEDGAVHTESKHGFHARQYRGPLQATRRLAAAVMSR
jgi:hypothetical protein